LLLEVQVYLGVTAIMVLAVAAEVSHRRRLEQALELQAETLRQQANVVDLAPLLVRNTSDCITRWNSGAERLYGFTPSEAAGKDAQTLLQTRFPEPPADIRAKLFTDGQWQGELRQKTRDGQEIVVASQWVLHRDKHGEPEAILEVDNDITELKRAEERFHLAVESAPNAMVMVNQDGRIVLANTQTEKLFGYRRDELMGQPVEILVPAQFRSGHPDYRRGFFAEPQARPMGAGRDLYGLRKDGTEFPVEIGLNPFTTNEGTWVLSAIVDITERKRLDSELRGNAERLQLTLEAGSMGVWEWEIASGRVSWSSGLEAIHGLAPGAFGGTFEDCFRDAHPDDRPAVMQSITRSLEENVDHDIEYRIICPDGGIRWVQGKGRAVHDASGNTVGMAGVCADVTERKRAEEERAHLLVREQASRTEAERANRLKDEFLAIVSHELRTPLTAVLGWAKLLRSGRLDESTSERAFEVIERNAKIQAKLIDDILDLSRVVSGKLLLDLHAVQLPATINAAIETVRPDAESKGVQIETVLDCDAASVQGDAERLQQVVWNLLSNAVKFTPGGGRVEVRLERLESHVEIKVSDTGKGIQAEFLPHVFDPFRQADASPSRMHGGLGLGLAIVQRLVDLHGGTVQAYSDGLGTGATFTVRLPLVAGDLVRKDKGRAHDTLREAVPALRGLRALVVEDDPDTRHFLTILLESHGVKVSGAASAKEALQVFSANRPDVLICDIGLPGEDGYALLRQVRALGADKGGNTPALALTAYAGLEDRQRVLAAGFQMHVAKPMDPLLLTRAIEQIVRTPLAVADKAPKKRSRRTVFKVVVVDDSKDLADLFAAVLREMGHDVHVFHDGPAALAQIGKIKPEIVFSDISMRQMDGYQLAKRIREMPELRSSTLVAMTGFSQGGAAGHTLRAGFDYHLVKPVLGPQLSAFFAALAAET
jgi:PAS domain S-box-containing protein